MPSAFGHVERRQGSFSSELVRVAATVAGCRNLLAAQREPTEVGTCLRVRWRRPPGYHSGDGAELCAQFCRPFQRVIPCLQRRQRREHTEGERDVGKPVECATQTGLPGGSVLGWLDRGHSPLRQGHSATCDRRRYPPFERGADLRSLRQAAVRMAMTGTVIAGQVAELIAAPRSTGRI